MGYFGIFAISLIPLVIFLIVYGMATQFSDTMEKVIGIGIGIVYMGISWAIIYIFKITYVDIARFVIIGSLLLIGIMVAIYAFSEGTKEGIIAVIIAALIIIPFSIPIIPSGLITNAKYMENNVVMITSTPTNPIFPFETEPDPTYMRFVTEEFAKSIANQHASEIGSNAEFNDASIIRVNGSLFWCIMYKNSQFMKSEILSLVLIDVNNPNTEPTIISMDNWFYATDLWLGNDIANVRYYHDQDNTWKNQKHYPAYDDVNDKWVYVSTATKQTSYWGGQEANGLFITDVTTGVTTDYFSMDDIHSGNIPDYCIQVISEEYLESMIDNWGEYRDTTENENIDIWAGSIINGVSEDRFKMTEDVRYIVDPNNSSEVIGIVPIVPYNKESSLYGYFVIDNRAQMTFYNLNAHGLISPSVAGATVRSLLTQPNEGKYEAGMPIMYSINMNSQNTTAYYVPVYWTNNVTYRMSHFAIVSAKDTSYNVLIDASNKAPSAAVIEARSQFVGLYVDEEDDENILTAEITSIGSYVDNGDTVFVIETNNSEYIRFSESYLNSTQWNEIVLAEVGNKFEYTITIMNNIMWCTYYRKIT